MPFSIDIEGSCLNKKATEIKENVFTLKNTGSGKILSKS